jgi:outer membrane protein assembly factor BamD (BamD/ComL family)
MDYSISQRGMTRAKAEQRIQAFAERFGKPHLYFAYHAAFPLTLNPDLLYRIWANFQRDIHQQVIAIPWVAVADLLLSSLCEEVGGEELYEMNIMVRNLLIEKMTENPDLGAQRIRELSAFLFEYIERQLYSEDPEARDLAQVQKWTALAYTDANAAAHELAMALKKSIIVENQAEQLKLASILDALASPLTQYQPLLTYVRQRRSTIQRGRAFSAPGTAPSPTTEGITIAGISLPPLVSTNYQPSDMDSQVARLFNEAQAAMAKGEWAAAAEKLEAVLARRPGHQEAVNLLSRALQEEQLRKLYKKAHEEFEAGHLDEAEDLFRQVENLRSNYVDVDFMLNRIESRRRAQESPPSNTSKKTYPDVFITLDLRFDRVDERRYRIRARDSMGYEATATIQFSLTELEHENLLLRLELPERSGQRGVNRSTLRVAEEIGTRLFNDVFRDEIRYLFERCLAIIARERGTILRIRLHLGDTSELAELPWEYLYHPNSGQFLSLASAISVIRYVGSLKTLEPVITQSPLKVLVVNSSPYGYPAMDEENRLLSLRAVFERTEIGLIEWDVLRNVTLVAFAEQLSQKDYHVLHFIGHARFNEVRYGEQLVFVDENRQASWVSGETIGYLLRKSRQPRLVILDIEAEAQTSRRSSFSGLSLELIKQGISAVVTMQLAITDNAAGTFAQTFYTGLAEGLPMDEAMSAARRHIFASSVGEVRFGAPVLYMSSSDGRLIEIGKEQAEKSEEPRIELLSGEAEEAMAGERWQTAIEKFQAILRIDPANILAATRLNVARQEEELASLYAQSVEHFEAGRWADASDAFRRVKEIRHDYKDVNDLINKSVEKEFAEKAAAQPRQTLEPAERLDSFFFNGINGATGEYLLPTLTLEQISVVVRNETQAKKQLTNL